MDEIFDFKNWLNGRKEFISIVDKNHENWYLSNDDIYQILLISKNGNLNFFPTKNGPVPCKILAYVITYIANFEKYKVKFFKQRLKRLLMMNGNQLKANSKYNYFLKYGKEEGLKLFYEKNKNSALTLENLKKRYGDDEGLIRWNNFRKKQSGGIERFIRYHGKEEGIKLYNEWCKKNGGNYSLERLKSIYGEEEGQKRYDETQIKIKSFGTLKYFIDKYGEEEGTLRYQDKINKLHFGASLEGFIKKYGEEEGPILFKRMKDNTSLNSFLTRYGEEEGTLRYQKFVEKIYRKPSSCVSKESLKYFKPLSEILSKYIKNDDIFTGIGGKKYEYYLKYYYGNIPKAYFYDFTILSKKLIIEFNGSYYHAKKEFTYEEKIKWEKHKRLTADESIAHDEHKLLVAKLNRIFNINNLG